ncbi:MAG: hypothetical protein ACREJV_08785 [Candidatus Rokuibacteriota bacterium]
MRARDSLTRAAGTLVVALTLGWVTALIAPPAISVTISKRHSPSWSRATGGSVPSHRRFSVDVPRTVYWYARRAKWLSRGSV